MFSFIYYFLSQVYPTATRALGMGSCSAMARVGAVLTPFVAQVRFIQYIMLTGSSKDLMVCRGEIVESW